MPTAAVRRATLLPAVLVALAGAAPAAAEELPRMPPRTWYVDNTAPDGGDGSLVAPFSTLGRAERASDVGDILYVFRGDGTSRGLDEGIRLKPRQRLVGSGAPLAAPGEEPLPAGEPPLLSASQGAVVELSDRASVAGVAITGAGEAGIRARGARAIAVQAVRIDGGSALEVGLELSDVQGAAVTGLAVAGAAAHAVLVERCGGISIHDSRLDHGGDRGAALALRDPAGHVEIVMVDIHPTAGTALSVDARAGTSTVSIQRVSLSAPAEGSEASGTGIEVLASGTAALDLEVVRAVLSGLGDHGVSARAGGDSRLRLRLAESGVLGDAPRAEAVALHASGRAEARIEVVGNDLPASELALFLTAAGQARLAAEVTDNAVPGVPRGRGFAVVLGERAEGSVRLLRNQLDGHGAETLYVVADAASRLALEARDNRIAPAAAPAAAPLPAVLLHARDEARLCVALSGNRVGPGAGGGPPLALRQHDAAVIAVAGHEPASTGSPGAVLAASNELTPNGVTLDGALGSPAGLLCPTPAATPLAAR